MSISDLPPELYRIIASNITDRPTLLSLLRTSRYLSIEAERSLYHTFDNIHDVKRQTLFLQRVVDCPRLARFVRSYRIHSTHSTASEALRTFCNSTPCATRESQIFLFWTLFPVALRLFVNLKVLTFHSGSPYDGGPDVLPMARFLRGCPFQLETLEWGWYTPNEPRDLLPFLATQQHLHNISLRGWDAEAFPGPAEYTSTLNNHAVADFDTDSAEESGGETSLDVLRRTRSGRSLVVSSPAQQPDSPSLSRSKKSKSYHCSLSALTGCLGVIRAFLPGHRITHLRWLSDLDDPWNEAPGFSLDTPGFADSLRQIQYLHFGTWFARPGLGILAPYLSQVIFLELTDVDKHSTATTDIDNPIPLGFGRKWRRDRDRDGDGEEDSRMLTSKLFRTCVSLQMIDIALEPSRRRCVVEGKSCCLYTRWRRDAGLVDSRLAIHDDWPDIALQDELASI
ncbi:hypothetical protein GYMLUDRAFT_245423 [Collybiopsis luxurians FD-317 M1]|uniref:F-box domain-containing protein n=1 Tax=Collybiopsis luxurians FD-317 M1 TaxID=944289 RepID=A0A0D0B7A6_9AGAR|nr:hypothetical protein GYMLUDRAFT_245423 [Collybiopsis luxurians FD-317 M1]